MHLLIVALCAAGLLLGASEPASAAPIAALIVGALQLTGIAATIATTVITAGLTFGASLLVSALIPKPKSRVASNAGVQSDIQLGGDVYWQLAFGLVASAGHLAYHNESGDDNKQLDRVYVLPGSNCDGLSRLWVDGELVTITQISAGTGWTKYAVTLPDDEGVRRLWVTFWEGRPDQIANPTLIATSNPAGRWTAEHYGRGVCYVHLEAEYKADLKAFRGYPDVFFEYRGCKVYDIRKDSTAGGSGAHRFGDWSTWEWSENPAVCLYHFMAGYLVNGQRVGGMAVPVYDLIGDLFMVAANVCDEQAETEGGGFEDRYRVSLLTDDGEEHWTAVETFVDAMGGRMLERSGMFAPLAGAAYVPVATITDDDLITDAPLRYTAKRPRTDLLNEIWSQCLDPDEKWGTRDVPPLIGNAAVKAEDGGETLPAQKTYAQVRSTFQAQRLDLIAFKANRLQPTATIALGLEALAYEIGDWITWDSARYGEQDLQIVDTEIDLEADRVTLTLEATDVSVYSDDPLSAITAPPSGPGTAPRLSTVSGLVVQATTAAGAGGQQLPAYDLSWVEILDDTIRSVVIEHRIVGSLDATRVQVVRPATGAWTGTTLVGGFMAATNYEFRASITTFPPRITTWTAWIPIQSSSGYTVPSASAVYDGIVRTLPVAELFADLTAALEREERTAGVLLAKLTADHSDRITTERGFARAVSALSASVSDQGVALAESVLVLEAQIDANAAAIVVEQTARATADDALAQSITTLTATVNNNTAAITQEQIARADGDSALSSSLTSLSTTVNGNTASIATLATSVDGIEAQYVLAVTAGGAVGGFTVRGIKKADGTGQIDFGIAADRFYIVNPSNTNQVDDPFVFTGGVLYVREANIPTLTTDKITGLEAYIENIFAVEINATTIRTEQLVLGGQAITTGLLADQSVTTSVSVEPGQANWAGTDWQTIASAMIAFTTGQVIVLANQSRISSATWTLSPPNFQARLLRNGVEWKTLGISPLPATGNNQIAGSIVVMERDTTPVGGNVTYTLQVRQNAGGGSPGSTNAHSRCPLILLNTKR